MRPPADRPGQQGRGRFHLNSPRAPLWILLALTAIILVAGLWFSPSSGSSPAELSYSDFLVQVRAGNVRGVEMDGPRVRGELKEPIQWSRAGRANAKPHDTFVTALPPVPDQRLLPLLDEQGVTITARASDISWIVPALVGLAPVLALGAWMALSLRRVRQQDDRGFATARSPARAHSQNRPQTSFADVAGEDQAKLELTEIVNFLQRPYKYHRLGARIPRGVLLVGPPGTGKTLLARAVAGEAEVPFHSISASEFVEVYVGLGASRVRDLFDKARREAPSIVFVDELDAVGRRRGARLGTGNEEREHTLNQLLVEMDGFDTRSEVVVMAATNRPDVLDPALLRPGRFDRQVTVGLPDRKGRAEILRIHARHLVLASDVDLDALAQATPGFSGADLANLCNEAALLAARHDRMRVDQAAFHEALDKLMLGTERPLLMDKRERLTVAYHEAGHALMATILPGADPVHRVTIIPHGGSLGLTAQVPAQEHYNRSRDDLFTQLTVLMAGRAAEQLALGQMTTGAENDFLHATELARGMVVRWGMSDALGPVGYRSDDLQAPAEREYSESTGALIDVEVRRILDETRQRAAQLLVEHRAPLDRLAESLLREETMDAASVAAIVHAQSEPKCIYSGWNP